MKRMNSLVEKMKAQIKSRLESGSTLTPQTQKDATKAPLRVQIESDPEAGKTHALMSIAAHYHEILKLPPEKVLVCVIDFDQGGVEKLIAAGTFPNEYQDSIIYLKVKNIWEAYEAYEVFRPMLVEHKKTHGVLGWLCVDNIGRAWDSAQQEYCKEVFGRPLHEHKRLKRKEAYQDGGKRNKPLFDMKTEWHIIYSIHDELMWDLSEGRDFHMAWTCYLKDKYEVVEDEQGNKKDMKVGITSAGRKEIDGRVDHVIRLVPGGTKAMVMKSRGVYSKNLAFDVKKRMPFTSFVMFINAIKKEEIKKLGYGNPLMDRWTREWTEDDYDGIIEKN